jgi:hypothetical protein
MGYIFSLIFMVFGCAVAFIKPGVSAVYAFELSALWALVGEFGSLVSLLEDDEDQEGENE